MARAVIPEMKARGWGRIIHISGHDRFMPIPNRVHNITCKAGSPARPDHLQGRGVRDGQSMAIEFVPFGITANIVAPGLIDITREWTRYTQFHNGYQWR
jgi:3-oxoacyl-[acyl-carrier protein] reductase